VKKETQQQQLKWFRKGLRILEIKYLNYEIHNEVYNIVCTIYL